MYNHAAMLHGSKIAAGYVEVDKSTTKIATGYVEVDKSTSKIEQTHR